MNSGEDCNAERRDEAKTIEKVMRRRSSSHAIESVRLVTQATYQALKVHKVFQSYQRLRKKAISHSSFRKKSCHKIHKVLTSSRLWFISGRRWLHGDSFITKFFSLLIRLYYSKIIFNAFSIVTRDNCCWYFKYDTNKKEYNSSKAPRCQLSELSTQLINNSVLCLEKLSKSFQLRLINLLLISTSSVIY